MALEAEISNWKCIEQYMYSYMNTYIVVTYVRAYNIVFLVGTPALQPMRKYNIQINCSR